MLFCNSVKEAENDRGSSATISYDPIHNPSLTCFTLSNWYHTVKQLTVFLLVIIPSNNTSL